MTDPAADERAAVVAWLRRWNHGQTPTRAIRIAAATVEIVADAIERGEHRKERP